LPSTQLSSIAGTSKLFLLMILTGQRLRRLCTLLP
jgi:hypothetical protein